MPSCSRDVDGLSPAQLRLQAAEREAVIAKYVERQRAALAGLAADGEGDDDDDAVRVASSR
jgi:hypothetical protein